MTGLVFVDTNVLLCRHSLREPQKRRAVHDWLELLWRTRTGRTSTQVLNEYYHNATRKLQPAISSVEAWDTVLTYFAWDPVAVDAELIHLARDVEQRCGLSWWDCLIVGAARAQSCSVLLTEDLQDGAAYEGVTVRSPFTSGIAEIPASYLVTPTVERRHRPRGRPRTAVA